jgi:hypothetical protein
MFEYGFQLPTQFYVCNIYACLKIKSKIWYKLLIAYIIHQPTYQTILVVTTLQCTFCIVWIGWDYKLTCMWIMQINSLFYLFFLVFLNFFNLQLLIHLFLLFIFSLRINQWLKKILF